ncbi:MAG: M23 family metallopeptidase [Alphaproteobacteria bacterium]|nr:M23 family metallopeptidase [Alphaproteobacteria bacterium]
MSTPKVTSTAVGEPIANKEKKEKLQATTGNIKNKSLSNSNKMRMPVNGKIISHFGDISDGIANDGINIKANKGTDVIAAADGTVIYVGSKLDEEYGNVVIVQHDNGLITSYAHLDKALVKKDKKILAGEKLGTVGQTGDVQEPQLYFEVMKDKKPVNPLKYLKK